MTMRLLITEITRMSPGYICVAGIDLDTGERVRPVMPGGGQIPLAYVVSYRGPVRIARVFSVAQPWYVGIEPEIEDYEIDLGRCQVEKDLDYQRFLDVLRRNATPDWQTAFGDELVRSALANGWNALRTAEGCGDCSLVLATLQPGEFRVEATDRGLRALWPRLGFNFSVTDLRLYQLGADNRWEVREERLTVLQSLIRAQPVIVAFGLTRPWAREGDPQRYHWLQVNAIHTEGLDSWSC